MNGRRAAFARFHALAFLIMFSSVAVPNLFDKEALSLSFDSIINLSATDDGESTRPKMISIGDNVYVVWEDNESGSEEILFSKSTDNGENFTTPTSVITTLGDPQSPNLAASGDNDVHVVYSDEGEILLVSSSDGGDSFSDPINISNSTEDGRDPQIATSGEQLYVAWVEEVAEGSRDIFIAVSGNSGTSFTAPHNLSNSSADSTAVQLYPDEELFVVWQEQYETQPLTRDVFISKSVDNGQAFNEPVNLSESLAGISSAPQISGSGSSIYVAWVDLASLNAFMAVSTDTGETFGSPENLSSSNFVFSQDSDIAASGTRGYIVWSDEIGGLPEIFLTSVEPGGPIFSAPINVSNSSDMSSLRPRVAVSNTDPDTVYVLWRELSPANIFLAVSSDGGLTFGAPVNLSSNDSSASLDISTSGNKLHIVWEDTSLGPFEVMYRAATDSGPPTITIDTVSESSPRWGLDPVSIFGTVNGNATDIIVVNWGDGVVRSVELNGSSWGPVSHSYNSTATGARGIVVELRDELGIVKASATSEVIVQKHGTSLLLNDILSVIQGSEVPLTGRLMDADSNDAIFEATINFTGTGVPTGNLSAITQENGTFSLIGISPDIASTFSVQAKFSGNVSFEESQSNIVGYDTVAPNTTQFAIPEGEPSGPIDLVGFNVSLLFDDVQSAGSVFVSNCTPTPSPRYIAIDGACVKISPVVELQEGSSAYVTINYDPLAIPTGYSEDDIGLFRESVEGVVDITQSRNSNATSVTGRTTDFSVFLLGMALHDSPQVGAETLPIFVGSNDLLFEFPEVSHISFHDEEFNVGDIVSVRVSDGYANLDNDKSDNLNATIVSTSDPSGIILRLQESGHSTGIFEGTFTLISGTSSNVTSVLHAERNDKIAGFYNARVMMPLKMVISDVIEAGLVEVSSAEIPRYLRAGPNLVDVYDVDLVDSRLGSGANVTMIMSYANFPDISDPLELAITTVDETECFDVISLNSTNGINELDKTIYGYTTATGRFALVRDDHSPADRECFSLGVPPGGSGGGAPQPGSIIVIDALAAVASPPRGGGSGGGGSNAPPPTPISDVPSPAPPSSGSETVPPGENGEVIVTLRNGTGSSAGVGVREVRIQMQNITSGGSITVTTTTLGAVSHLFNSSIGHHAHVNLEGTNYTTVGDVYEIESSSQLEFDGTVDVIIPYDENLVSNANVGLPSTQHGNETDVRFLHYNGSSWEDVTIGLNTTTNTVIGRLSTGFSPVVAALSNDGTFSDSYFESLSNKKFIIQADKTDLKTEAIGNEQHGTFTFSVKNVQRINQTYVFIFQIVDEQGIVQHLAWSEGDLGRAQQVSVTNSFIVESKRYSVQLLVLDQLENPVLLSDPQVLHHP